MKNKTIKIFPILLLSLLLTGCWDSVEIDRKAFVSTIGIDIGDNISRRNQILSLKNQALAVGAENEDDNFLKLTYGFPDIRNMDRQKNTAEELSITVDGYSMSDAYFKALSKGSRKLHFGHSKLLIISDELFKYPEVMKEVMDFIQREPSVNRTITMIIVKGKAKDFIGVKPITEDSVDKYITSLLGNSAKSGIVAPTTLTKYIDVVKSYNTSILPVFSLKNKNDIELTSMAVIQDFTIKKYLNATEFANVQILKGDVGACLKSINREGHIVDYYINGVESDLHVSYRDHKLYLNYNIQTEGSLKGYYTGSNDLDEARLKSIQEDFNKSMEEELENIIDFSRYDMGIDIIGIDNNVRRYHRQIWGEVGGKWIETFKDAEVSVIVNNNIRRIGISN